MTLLTGNGLRNKIWK